MRSVSQKDKTYKEVIQGRGWCERVGGFIEAEQ